MNDTLQRIGQRIRELRVQRGFASQEALAEYLDVHRTFVGHLETGRKDFRLSTIIRIAAALGVSLSELFAGIEAGEPLKAKSKSGGGLADEIAVRKEMASLERSVERLKKLL